MNRWVHVRPPTGGKDRSFGISQLFVGGRRWSTAAEVLAPSRGIVVDVEVGLFGEILEN